VRGLQRRDCCCILSNFALEMTASLLAVKNNSLLPSQSIFNEIQSIHDTGFFHEMESGGKESGIVLVSIFFS